MDANHKLILAVGITAIVTDLIPTPADYFVFKYHNENKKKLDSGEITPKQYWLNDAKYYYLLNPAYWALVTGAVFVLGKDFDSKVYWGIGIVSAGAVLSILAKNIEEEQKKA